MSNKSSIQIIRENKLIQSTLLCLSKMPLEKSQEYLWELTHLEELIICDTDLKNISNNIEKLVNLKRLTITTSTEMVARGIFTRYACGIVLPKNIGNLPSLTYLNLSDNDIRELPDSIGNLSNLEELDLSRNYITNIPDSIGNLSKLTKLNLSYNSINKLPYSIDKLHNLTRADLDMNRLDGFSIDICKLFNLKLPDLLIEECTRFHGDNIRQLSNLVVFYIFFNHISTFHKSFVTLADLSSLSIEHHSIFDWLILQTLPNLQLIKSYGHASLPSKYWTKKTDNWKIDWLLDKLHLEVGNNHDKVRELREALILGIGYQRIIDETNSTILDIQSSSTLFKISYLEEIEGEPMILLKMIDLSVSKNGTYIIRVPPDTSSIEQAFDWINIKDHPQDLQKNTWNGKSLNEYSRWGFYYLGVY